MSMLNLSINVYGVSIEVRSPDNDFNEFVRRNYEPFLISSFVEAPCISVLFSPKAGHLAQQKGQKLSSLGAGIRVSGDSLYWENEFGFKIFVKKTINRIDILSYHFDLTRTKDREERYKNFQRSMRWAIHFPLFWLLKRKKNMNLAHASAVCRDDKALIFCGLNGVGKSTIALKLAKTHRFKFVTDNFLLTDSQMIYGFPERVRLSAESWKRLSLGGVKSSHDFVYNKYQLDLDNDNIQLISKPSHVFLMLSGRHLEFTPLNRPKALKIISGIHDYLQEFPEYSFYALMSFLDFENDNFPKISLFPGSCQFSIFQNPMDWNLDKSASEVLRYVSEHTRSGELKN